MICLVKNENKKTIEGDNIKVSLAVGNPIGAIGEYCQDSKVLDEEI